jgi:hypothetical protein
MRKALHRWLLIPMFSILVLTGCYEEPDIIDPVVNQVNNFNPEEIDNRVVTSWFDLFMDLTKSTPGYSPPVAARTFGYLGVGLYESIVPGSGVYRSLAGQLEGLVINSKTDPALKYHYGAAANCALAELASKFYGHGPEAGRINQTENMWNRHFRMEAGDEVFLRSASFGIEIAKEIYEWSKTDGGHEGWGKNYSDEYVPPVGRGLWVPTSEGMKALQPFWGQNRPFLTGSVAGCQPPQHSNYSEDEGSQFYKEAKEVYEKVKFASEEEIKIAKYWSDDQGATATPAGHSVSIAVQIIRNEKLNLAKSAELIAKVGIAVNDAFISCWKTKYVYNLLRPVTYVRSVIDPNWEPVLETPPFPEYASGHSVQSGAVAKVMAAMFGDFYEFTDRTHEKRNDIDGTPRTFRSFHEMAKEAAMSRLYGGIHFMTAINLGISQGYEIGRLVNNLKFTK